MLHVPGCICSFIFLCSSLFHPMTTGVGWSQLDWIKQWFSASHKNHDHDNHNMNVNINIWVLWPISLRVGESQVRTWQSWFCGEQSSNCAEENIWDNRLRFVISWRYSRITLLDSTWSFELLLGGFCVIVSLWLCSNNEMRLFKEMAWPAWWSIFYTNSILQKLSVCQNDHHVQHVFHL